MLISKVREDLCLDFINTLSWRGSKAPGEALGSLADLIAWLAEHAAIAPLPAWAGERERDTLPGEAIEIREMLHRIFSTLASGAALPHLDLAALNREIALVPQRRRLIESAGGCAWVVEPEPKTAAALLTPVLWSAGDLLVNAERQRIRQCGNEECRWLFLDRSKGGTRRWCHMSACGNRAKARRHYTRMTQA